MVSSEDRLGRLWSGWNISKASPYAFPLDLGRDPALDLVKGLLVLGMIAYHAGVSFIPNTHIRFLVLHDLLDFVSGSWVFVCGLIVTTHYRLRFQVDARNVSRRLWIRAAKMILLFCALNIFVVLLGIRQASQLFDGVTMAKILLYGDGALTSFGILLGIGYVLFIGPFFLYLKNTGRVLALLIIAFAAYLAWSGHVVPGNLWIILCGLAGMVVGVTVWPLFVWEIRPSSSRRWFTVGGALSAAAAYFLISIGLDIHRDNLPVYLWGVASIIAVFYLSYGWFSSIPTISDWLQLLGRYSLVSYLSQMTIFRLALGAQSHFGVALSYWLTLLAVLFMVSLMVFMLDKEIRESKTFQKSYRLVFG